MTAKAIAVVGVLLGMVHAHELGIVHGALRPDCVFFDAEHRPKICGFGLKNQALAVQAVLAPETSEWTPAMPPGDVFSFSLMIYAVVTGNLSITAREAFHWLELALRSANAQIGGPPSLVNLPGFLAKLILQGLSEDPDERPLMDDFLDEFEDRNFAIFAGADANAVSAFAAWADDGNEGN
jgi:serine/threonine protein kinase